MAIVEMQKLSICASKKNRKAVLELLQSLGTMEVRADRIEDSDLLRMDTQKQRIQFEKDAESFEQALALLKVYAPHKKSGGGLFSERKLVDRTEYESVASQHKRYLEDAKTVLQAEKEMNEYKGLILRDQNLKQSLAPWKDLDIPMNAVGTKKTAVLIGTMQGSHSEAEIFAMASAGLEEPVPISVHVFGSENDLTYMTVLCLIRDQEKVEENLRSEGFSRPSQLVKCTPAQAMEEQDQDIRKQEALIEECKNTIASYGDQMEDFRMAADYYRSRAAKYKVLGEIPQSESMFFLEGWVPKDKAERVAKLLTDRYGALVETEEKAADEIEPTILSNNPFSDAVEGVLESYGLPQHGHIDPTFIMSIFYVFFFGMMLSDAAYGLVMFFACGAILLKYKRLDSGTKKMMKLFCWCGLSTTFWGFMYGGFFGDAIDVVAYTFFGVPESTEILKPLWFAPMDDPMRLLVWCMLFGLIHLFFGLGIKGAEYLKGGDVVGFVSDVLAWYAFIVGLVLLLLPSDLFKSIAGMEFAFPAWVGMLSKVLTIGGMLIILVMSGRATKNWGVRIALGAYDIYGVTGWLSDVLSYSRLLALGMATGVIATVVNMMGSMGGGGVVGAIVFILVFLLGHTLNIGINVLGAYVHTNRLQFVEFFGKFYEGGGKKFAPFKAENKYIEIKEDK